MLMATGIVCSVNTVTQIEKAALESSGKYSSGLDARKLEKMVAAALVLAAAETSGCRGGAELLLASRCRGGAELLLASRWC